MDKALKNLARNPDLITVLTALKEEYIQALMGTAPTERDIREECYTKVMTLTDLETWVKNYGEK